MRRSIRAGRWAGRGRRADGPPAFAAAGRGAPSVLKRGADAAVRAAAGGGGTDGLAWKFKELARSLWRGASRAATDRNRWIDRARRSGLRPRRQRARDHPSASVGRAERGPPRGPATRAAKTSMPASSGPSGMPAAAATASVSASPSCPCAAAWASARNPPFHAKPGRPYFMLEFAALPEAGHDPCPRMGRTRFGPAKKGAARKPPPVFRGNGAQFPLAAGATGSKESRAAPNAPTRSPRFLVGVAGLPIS